MQTNRDTLKRETNHLDPIIKYNWELMQARHDYPINAVGNRIDPEDGETLSLWRKEGIEGYMQG